MFIKTIWARKCFYYVFGLLLAGTLVACGGGGGGGGNPLANLAGTWFGTLEDSGGAMHTISVTLDGSGNLTQEQVDGAVVPGLTATITHKSGNIYSFTFSDGTVGGFFVDSSFTHAAFVDEDFNFGVVQKGASALPAYVYGDLDGSWSGVTVATDFVAFAQTASSATCTVPNCTATSGGVTSNVSFPNATFDAGLGRWRGSYTASDATDGEVRAFLTPDKAFAGTWACQSGGFFPDFCEFAAWRKQ